LGLREPSRDAERHLDALAVEDRFVEREADRLAKHVKDFARQRDITVLEDRVGQRDKPTDLVSVDLNLVESEAEFVQLRYHLSPDGLRHDAQDVLSRLAAQGPDPDLGDELAVPVQIVPQQLEQDIRNRELGPGDRPGFPNLAPDRIQELLDLGPHQQGLDFAAAESLEKPPPDLHVDIASHVSHSLLRHTPAGVRALRVLRLQLLELALKLGDLALQLALLLGELGLLALELGDGLLHRLELLVGLGLLDRRLQFLGAGLELLLLLSQSRERFPCRAELLRDHELPQHTALNLSFSLSFRASNSRLRCCSTSAFLAWTPVCS